jgi:hypothetical protein
VRARLWIDDFFPEQDNSIIEAMMNQIKVLGTICIHKNTHDGE